MNPPESLRLLSVEDNWETRLLLRHFLEDFCDFSFAPTAEEALGRVESEPFDLLLVDINLGEGKNGTELLHIVRGREDLPELPAVALTAYALPGDREKLLEKGFDAYQEKPFTRAELTETINQALSSAGKSS